MHASYSMCMSDDFHSVQVILPVPVFLSYCLLWTFKNINKICYLPASSLCSNTTSSEMLCLPFNYLERLSNLLNNTQVNSCDSRSRNLRPRLCWYLETLTLKTASLAQRFYKFQICISKCLMDTPLRWGFSKSICPNLNSWSSSQIWDASSPWIGSPSIHQAPNLSPILNSLPSSPIPPYFITYYLIIS